MRFQQFGELLRYIVWLDKITDFVDADLKYEVGGPTRLRKTREILMNMWYYESEAINAMRKEGLARIGQHSEAVVPVSLCILYAAYPIVADICKSMGRMFETHDEITNAMLKQKLYDQWGTRGALESICRRGTLTLKEMGILREASHARYVLETQLIVHQEVVSFVLSAIMKIDGKSTYSLDELQELELLFPFIYEIDWKGLRTDRRFTMSTFGGRTVISLHSD